MPPRAPWPASRPPGAPASPPGRALARRPAGASASRSARASRQHLPVSHRRLASPLHPRRPPEPSSSPTAGSGSGSGLIWLWVLLGVIVLAGVIVGIVRARGRRSAAAGSWRSSVVDAYAKGSALHDAMSVAETPGALGAYDAGARWSDIQRRADDLTQTLYALREAAPDDESRAQGGRCACVAADCPLRHGRRACSWGRRRTASRGSPGTSGLLRDVAPRAPRVRPAGALTATGQAFRPSR